MYSQSTSSKGLNENQFECLLHDAFPNQLQVPSMKNNESTVSWLDRQGFVHPQNSRIL
jgi:hypothetical protein